MQQITPTKRIFIPPTSTCQQQLSYRPGGDHLEGFLPPGKMKMVIAWVEIHKEDLMADWELAANGQQPFRIEPLR